MSTMAFTTSLSSSRNNGATAAASPDGAVQHRYFILRHGQTDANAGGLIQGSSDFCRLTEYGKEQAATAGRLAFRSTIPLSCKSDNDDNDDDDDDDDTRQDDHDENLKFQSVYVSPLTRAQQTLTALRETRALSLPTNEIVLDNLREIDFYTWEGKSKDELQAKHPDAWHAWNVGDPYQLRVPATNDSISDMDEKYPLFEVWERAGQVWQDIRQREANKNNSQDCPYPPPPSSSASSPCTLLVAHGSRGQALIGKAMGWDATHFRQHEFPNCGLVEIEWHVLEPHATRWRWRWPHVSNWKMYKTIPL